MSNTDRKAFFVAAALLLSLGPAYAAEPPQASAEQKVLDQFVGQWQSTYKVPKAEWTPKQKTGSAQLTTARVVGGRFIQEKSEHSDKTSGSALLTYDEQRKCYRSWWFSSTGQTCESTGQWDAETETMTWTSVEDAMTSTTRHRFLDDNNAEWSVSIKDPRGKVFFRIEGSSIRTSSAK